MSKNVTDLTPEELLEVAIGFALNSHRGQKDKAGKPYFYHPLRVMMKLIDEPATVQIVAVLHDVVEDCGVKLDTIEVFFGKEVRDAVDSVSRRVYSDGTKELYRDFVQRSKSNTIGRKVKLADLADNLSPERLGVLSVEEQGVSKRYKKAIAVLTDSEGL